MTAAVFLLIAVGVLGASPITAVVVGAAFGLVRGLAVLLGAPLRTTAALLAFHRHFDAWAEPVRLAVIGVQLGLAILAAWATAGVGLTILVAAVSAAIAAAALRNSRPARGAERTAAMSFGTGASR